MTTSHHSSIPIRISHYVSLCVCEKISRSEHRCASRCWCSPTSHHSNMHLKQPPEVLELGHESYIGGSLLFGLSVMHKQHTADLVVAMHSSRVCHCVLLQLQQTSNIRVAKSSPEEVIVRVHTNHCRHTHYIVGT